MKIPVVKIGNSKGIRLSKTLLEQYKIEDHVDVILKEDCIVLKPLTAPRSGWDEAFESAGKEAKEDQLIPDVFPDEDFEEWE